MKRNQYYRSSSAKQSINMKGKNQDNQLSKDYVYNAYNKYAIPLPKHSLHKKLQKKNKFIIGQGQINEIKKQKSTAELQLKNIKTKFLNLQNHNKKLQKLLKQIQTYLLQDNFQQNKKSIPSLLKENLLINAMKIQIIQLKDKINKANNQIEFLKKDSKINRKKQTMVKFFQQLEEKNIMQENIRLRIMLETKMEQNKKIMKQMKKQKDEEMQKNMNDKIIMSLKQDYEQEKKKLKLLINEKQELQSQITKFENKIKNLQKIIHRLQESNLKKSSEIEKLNNDKKTIEFRKADEFRLQIQSRYRQKMNKYESQLSSLREQKINLIEENQNLNNLIRQNEQNLKNNQLIYSDKIRNLQNQINILRNKFQIEEELRKKYKKEVIQLQELLNMNQKKKKHNISKFQPVLLNYQKRKLRIVKKEQIKPLVEYLEVLIKSKQIDVNNLIQLLIPNQNIHYKLSQIKQKLKSEPLCLEEDSALLLSRYLVESNFQQNQLNNDASNLGLTIRSILSILIGKIQLFPKQRKLELNYFWREVILYFQIYRKKSNFIEEKLKVERYVSKKEIIEMFKQIFMDLKRDELQYLVMFGVQSGSLQRMGTYRTTKILQYFTSK